MNDNAYKPLAYKAEAEVSGFLKLWQRKPWLAAFVCIAVLLWGCFPFFGWLNRGTKINELEKDNRNKADRVQELETQLVPFKTLALEKFSNADSNALKQLATTMVSLQHDYSNQIVTVNSLRSQLDHMRKLARKRSELLADNFEVFVATLKTMKPRKIACSVIPGDPEVVDFAKGLLNAFAAANWQPTNVVNKMQLDEFHEEYLGVSIYVLSNKTNQTDCLEIKRLLTSIGVQARIAKVDVHFDRPYDPEKEILLNVGRIDR